MIKFLKKTFGRMFKSLRMGMFMAIIFSVVLGTGSALLTNTLFKGWIDNKYNSEDSRNERYEDYIADLQIFVDKNELSSNDTDKILDWVADNRNIYLFIYKDEDLLFDGTKTEHDKLPDSSASGGTGKNEEDGKGDTESGGDNAENEDAESGASDTESGNDGNENNTGGKDNGTDEDDKESVSGGITIDYPTREEILAAAKERGQTPLTMSDGDLLVSLADFTEYIYYDAANIVSIVVGVLILTIVLMLYFQNILSKISALAKDVTNVYKVDMNTPIRTRTGDNELAELTRNVEEMRSSMMLSLEKEKEAINANTDLITSMSHDIRTPLTVLLGYLDIMKSSTDDTGMMEYIKASESTAMRLKELSDDMFRYFLVFGGGNINADLLEYDAKTLVEQLLSEHVLLLKERGYSVAISEGTNDSADVRVVTDAPKIMRVVDNIFSNIYKYADPERDIAVNTELDGKYLTISVSNVTLKSKNGAESNGIGLKTCKKLCEALGACFDYTEKSDENADCFVASIGLPISKSGESVNNEA